MEKIELVCIKEGGKLRVRIATLGYFTDANCIVPRELRMEHARYRVSPLDITLVTLHGTHYYNIRNRACIEVVSGGSDGGEAAATACNNEL